MGFKIAILLIPLEGCTLEEVIGKIYGNRSRLVESEDAVNSALYPEDQSAAFACEEDGNAWIFDWNLVPSALETDVPIAPNAGLFFLHSVTNSYAFTIIKNNKIVRSRFGSSDDGIVIDKGDLLQSERDAIAREAGNERFEELKSAWLDDGVFIEQENYDFSHVAFGEEIVFALLKDQSGIHLSRGGDRNEHFYSQPVFKITQQGFWSRFFK